MQEEDGEPVIYGRYVGESWREEEEPNLEAALGRAYLDYERGLALPQEIRLGSSVYDRQAILGLSAGYPRPFSRAGR